jgi:two-component system chemotaxis response regulator CheB
MRKKRVLIVEDSAVVSELLQRIVGADPRLEVAAAVPTAEEALGKLERLSPDVISLDIRLPGMQGLEATRRIMAMRPTPIVIVSAIDSSETGLSMQALRAGALSVVEKPRSATHTDYDAIASHLCTQLAIMSEVCVVRQKLPSAPGPLPAEASRGYGGALADFRLVGIAASTGGPSALVEILTRLGNGFPLPIAIVQHMTPTFVEGFGAWLGSSTRYRVEVVAKRAQLSPGAVYLPPGDRHLVVEGACVRADDAEPVSGHRPSGNVLFASMAQSIGAGGIGVVLTGMGDDGASGLAALQRAGGYTIAEDESTAVVYGMPASAVRAGAVREQLGLAAIADRVLELVGNPPRRSVDAGYA